MTLAQAWLPRIGRTSLKSIKEVACQHVCILMRYKLALELEGDEMMIGKVKEKMSLSHTLRTFA